MTAAISATVIDSLRRCVGETGSASCGESAEVWCGESAEVGGVRNVFIGLLLCQRSYS